jgi:hypothetical protein
MIDLTYTTKQESFAFEVASSIIMAIFLLFLVISLIIFFRIVVAIMSMTTLSVELPRDLFHFSAEALPDSHSLSMACFLSNIRHFPV